MILETLKKRNGFLSHLLLLSVFAFCGTVEAHAQFAARLPSNSGDTLSLNGTWRFSLAKNAAEAERLARFHDANFDAASFRPIPVPANWSLHGFEEPIYEHRFDEPPDKRPTDTEGFYLHRFRAPATLADRRTLLHFDGVWASAEVWLNGRALGRHDSGFTGFAFDVTRYIKPDAENTLAVRVRQNTKDTLFDTNDDWSLPGIYRDVYLEMMPREMYLDRIEIVTDFDSAYRDAELALRILVARHAGDRNKNYPFQLRAVLTDRAAREVARTIYASDELTGDNAQDVSLRLPVRAPAHWTAETPNLYDLRIELLVNNQVTHTRTERIGFREVSTSGGVLRINGQPVKLRGVNRHDEHPDVGRATTDKQWREDIRLMKQANINAVRTSHYPPAAGFIKLCDELGLYVMDEVPFGYGGDFAADPSYTSAVLLRAFETVARDRNRPSVIIWSIGNEDPFSNLHLAAIRMIKAADSTRPVLLPWRAEETLPPEVDILAPHYKTGEEYDALAAKARRPIVTTEYSHALGDEDFGGLEDRWQSLTKHPTGAGGMIWMWADQGLRRKVNGRKVLDPIADLGRYDDGAPELIRNSDLGNDEIYDARGIYGADGIVNTDRTLQRDFWETRAVYAPVSVLVKETPFRIGQSRIAVPVRNDFDFTDFSALRISWRLMADDRELAKGEVKIAAAPHTTAMLELPTSAIKQVERGVAYYVQVSFHHANGDEFAARSIRLVTETADASTPDAAVTANGKPRLSQNGGNAIVEVGNVRYEFNRQTGSLLSMTANGRRLITESRSVIWRPLSISEANLYRGAHRERPVPPDLNRYTTNVRSWNVAERADGVHIETEVEHRADERNKFSVRYNYHVTTSGALQVQYQVTPQVETGWLPEVGIELEIAPSLDEMRWSGLGILDSYPNESAAAMFGVWRARNGSSEIRGTKSGVEWAELRAANRSALRVTGSPYIRFDGTGREGGRVRLLTAVTGRSTKFKRPERSVWQLDASEVFKGGFTLKPLQGAN